MRRVSPGDPLRIPACTWNDLVAGLGHRRGNGAVPSLAHRQTVTCLVRNLTGAELPRFGVVGFGDPLIDPATSESEFLKNILFAGELATDGDYELRWGLTLAPIPAGKIGEVIVQGLAYCKIDADDTIETAGPASDGDVNVLVAADCGLARVLWRQSGTGPTWAIVCLG